MRVYLIKVPELLQPAPLKFRYPAHNKDYGVEQDFEIWIKKQRNLLTDDPEEANWHYLPVYWTRWHISNAFGEDEQGLAQLKAAVSKLILNDSKTFTITQFDGGTLIDLGKAVVFTAARTINSGIDIPILCSPHKKPVVPLTKKYTASFNGSFHTHPVREEIREKLSGKPEILIAGMLPTRFYRRWLWGKSFNINTMKSYVALCPRGTSANSFRFFEAMQLGTAPCLIGDMDVRPFKKFIPWDDFSYYVSSVDELEKLLDNLDKKEALKKGRKAFWFWKNEIYYQKWCKYVLMELDEIDKSAERKNV